MALGPSFGSLLNGYTQNTIIIFYIMVAFDLIYTTYIAFILPESMSPEALHAASELKRNSKTESTSTWWRKLVRKLGVVVAPLSMFLPRTIQRSGGRKRYDWGATFIGIAFALHATNSVGFITFYAIALLKYWT